ncbi:DUF3152 domain-containing protein [Plantactinospora sp. GCM10030261]|uniref:DUF3152 domain-containing protein n=1 Tax=Plantactinospora sp. GCM10030261 TaxID=3273420 RepID=UPI0036191E29
MASPSSALTDRRRVALVALLLILSAAAGYRWLATMPDRGPDPAAAGVGRPAATSEARPDRSDQTAGAGPSLLPSEAVVHPVPLATTAPTGPLSVPSAGPGTFAYAETGGPVLGVAGGLRSFRVAVERGAGQQPAEFAAAVDTVLGDPRGWIAGGDVRFQRVPGPAPADFTIYLATATTSERMCAEGGLATEGYTSCRLPGQVIINLTRWSTAVPGYGAPLAVYRTYAVNHEVGHELGFGHEACPAIDAPAPVMQQQTYGLAGCTANGWPQVGGHRYVGPPVP